LIEVKETGCGLEQEVGCSNGERTMSDLSILPVAIFAGMMGSFMLVLLFAVLTDKDPRKS
jgi:hypothetical protein